MIKTKRYSVIVLDVTSNPITESKYPIFPVDMKLLKEMFMRMEELLVDDIFERYIPEATQDITGNNWQKINTAKGLWKKDVDTYCSLCKLFGFKVNKQRILAKGRIWILQYEEKERILAALHVNILKRKRRKNDEHKSIDE